MKQIKKVKFGSDTFYRDITRSLMDTGFAIITGAPIEHEIINLSYEEWKGFFANSRKIDSLYDPETQSGFFPLGTENAKDQKKSDPKEFFHLYPGYNMPRIIPSQYSLVLRDMLEDLGIEILAGIDAFYNMSKKDGPVTKLLGLANMAYTSKNTLMRVLHYPPIPEKDREPSLVRAAAHEDINLITLLPVSTAPGLQVQDLDGEWHAVGGEPGDIVVNAGDMLQSLTNGGVKSTTHRVIVSSDMASKPRYSIALFVHAKPETLIADGKTAAEFLDERLRAIGIRK